MKTELYKQQLLLTYFVMDSVQSLQVSDFPLELKLFENTAHSYLDPASSGSLCKLLFPF